MKNYSLFLILTIITCGMLSCDEEEFLKEKPRDVLTADNLFVNPAGFENGLNAIYAQIRDERDGYGYSNMRSVFAVVSTDAYYISRFAPLDIMFEQFGNYLNSNSYGLNQNWVWLYAIINSANMIIERSDDNGIEWNSQNQKNGIIAQAKFFRAWAYRHLTYCWGDVPLKLDESKGGDVKTDWQRTSVSKVREIMEEDWLFAEQHLPDMQPAPGRISKAVAQHYLSELYLTIGEPEKGEIKALAAVENPNFKLITERYGVNKNKPGVPFMDQFYRENIFHNKGNTEVLWAFPYSKNTSGTALGSRMRRVWMSRYSAIPGVSINTEWGRGTAFLAITDFALNLYEEGDDRGSIYAIHRFVIKDNGDTVFTRLADSPEPLADNYRPSTQKWNDGDPDDPSAGNGFYPQPYLRLAETYLLLAEAQHLQNKNELAAETLNIIRRRSNASEINASQVTIDFILDERVRELLTEEHRRYTLLRMGKWLERTKLYNTQSGPVIAEHNKLWPIPQEVIDANLDAEFPQNPGY